MLHQKHYFKNRDRADSDLGSSLLASRHAHVEFLDEDGEWRQYSGLQARNTNQLILHKSSRPVPLVPLLGGQLEHEHRVEARGLGPDPDMVENEGAIDEIVPPSQDFDLFNAPFSPSFNFDGILFDSMRCFGTPNLSWTQTLKFDDILPVEVSSGSTSLGTTSGVQSLRLESSSDSSFVRDANFDSDHQALVYSSSTAVPTLHGHLHGAKSFAMSLVQHAKTIQLNDRDDSQKTKVPTVEDIIESLESLLPETNIPSLGDSSLAIPGKAAWSSSNLFKTLLYSFTNNFAGLRGVPRSSLMQLLREHHQMRTQLFEYIKSSPPGIAKSLADNFFRAAVEGCDADAVATVIHHTKDNPSIAIDPNEIACKFEGRLYTPIELAARFRNTELVRTLVVARADPNKTYGRQQDKYWEKGALMLALGHWLNGNVHPFIPSPAGEPEPLNLDLLRLLLDCGAEVRMDLAVNVMRPGPENTVIAEEIISRIPASDHRVCFETKWLALSIIQYLENKAAFRIIKRFFAHCSESADCGKCASENPRLVERMLCHAARRANLELSKFLVQHTSQLQSALAAAVRAGSDELINLFLDKGARVDGKVESWHPKEHPGHPMIDLFDENGHDRLKHPVDVGYVITPIRTPLAEAIRASNDQLINAFENLGALARIDEEYHFLPAVLAAAEVGNTLYLRKLLAHGPRPLKDVALSFPLASAIRDGQTDAALILLDAGATPGHDERLYGNALNKALERQNNRIVDSILESDVDLIRFAERNQLEIAATWCELDVIKDLIQLGGHIDSGMETTALGAAARSRNNALVGQLLDLGADPQAAPGDDRRTPLLEAMEIGDYDMVRFLISRGASPADDSAFVYAIRHDQVGFGLLLSEFKTRYPQGLPEFGGDPLAAAIELDDPVLFNQLLEARADVNSWMWGSKPPGYHDSVLSRAIQHRQGGNYEMVRRLLERGAGTNRMVVEDRRREARGQYLILETPLILAIKTKSLNMVSLLLEYGADLHRPARRGVKRTPLQAACETGSHKIVEFLLQRGARVNDPAAERYGGTALQMAAKSGSLRIVKLLLDNLANPLMPGSKVGGGTAFEIAAENGCLEILGVLWGAAVPLGFSGEECQRAKELAKEQGHRGCVGYIDFLSSRSSQSFLDD